MKCPVCCDEVDNAPCVACAAVLKQKDATVVDILYMLLDRRSKILDGCLKKNNTNKRGQ